MIGTGRNLLCWALALGVLSSGCRDVGDTRLAGEDAEPEPEAQLDPRVLASLPPGATPDMALLGRDLFVVGCAACHAPDGTGTALGPSLVHDDWIHTTREVDSIIQIVRGGVPSPREYPVPMPPREGEFNQEELQSLAAYVYALRGLGP
jgi:mono/diheme cytochrome c family protein